jgi:hypothetical protein
MFQFYANLLSADAKYAWNKIVKEQTEADPFKDFQGMSRKGPRGLLRKSFNDCVMFHLLTVYPNNAAEQEKYYLSNVLKKPQRVGVHQFVQCPKQINAYVMQLPCWYYSPSYNPGMTPANVLFSEADLASHVLWMCLHQWQDQYNLHKKRDDSRGYELASDTSQGNQARVYKGESSSAIQQENFSEEQDRNQAAQYCSY